MESGRPHSPLVNAARTRPEAEEFALKNRGMNDWYRHDGKNVESPTPPPLRLEEMHSPRTRPEAQEFAQKIRGTNDWYQPDGIHAESPSPRQNRPEAQEFADKNQSKGEWYKHDGEPVENPTPRSNRPEAQEFADKNRGTHDWYQHDGKNVETSPPQSTRLGNKTAKAIADKYKGDSEAWYGHNNIPNGKVNGHCTDLPRPKKSSGIARGSTPDAKRNYNKIKGTDETWYKHEENKNFVSPRPKSRLQGREATDTKEKSVGSGSEWYKYEHKNGYVPPKPKTRTTANAANNATKMRPNGTPVWASYDQNGVDHTDSRPQSRLTGEGVEFHERDKGSAGDWYAPNGTANGVNGNGNGHTEVSSPRRGSEESQKHAEKQKGESGTWFNHEANRHYTAPVKPARCASASARNMIEKTRGHELGRVMNHDTDSHQNGHGDSRIKPEAAEYAQKSVQGMMGKYMQTNGDYNSPRPASRVKPEAQENAAKNKGNMGEFMEGYLDTPKKHDVRRVRPEAEDNANRGRGAAASRAMAGDTPGSARKNTRLRGEASEKYADRNQGTKNLIGDFNGLQVSGTPIRHRSAQAAANAARWQGSEMNGIFNHN